MTTVTHTHTLQLDHAELSILRSALIAYVNDFGHDQADVLRAAKAVLAKVEDAPVHDASLKVPGGMPI